MYAIEQINWIERYVRYCTVSPVHRAHTEEKQKARLDAEVANLVPPDLVAAPLKHPCEDIVMPPFAPSSVSNFASAKLSNSNMLGQIVGAVKPEFSVQAIRIRLEPNHSCITANNWDVMFRAIEERLALTINQPFEHLSGEQFTAAVIRIRAAVLECVDAMETLHRDLINEGRRQAPDEGIGSLRSHPLASPTAPAEMDACESQHRECHSCAPADRIDGLPTDQGFVAMLSAYRATGGIARDSELTGLMRGHRHEPFHSLEKLIAEGHIFSFEWNGTYWAPMFQFNQVDFSIKNGVSQVLIELNTLFEGWGLAAWFAQPNCWLNDCRPADLMDSDLSAVLQAARANRFAVRG